VNSVLERCLFAMENWQSQRLLGLMRLRYLVIQCYIYSFICICFSFSKARYICINAPGFIKFCADINIIIYLFRPYISSLSTISCHLVWVIWPVWSRWLGACRGFDASAWCDQSELLMWISCFSPHKLWISDPCSISELVSLASA